MVNRDINHEAAYMVKRIHFFKALTRDGHRKDHLLPCYYPGRPQKQVPSLKNGDSHGHMGLAVLPSAARDRTCHPGTKLSEQPWENILDDVLFLQRARNGGTFPTGAFILQWAFNSIFRAGYSAKNPRKTQLCATKVLSAYQKRAIRFQPFPVTVATERK